MISKTNEDHNTLAQATSKIFDYSAQGIENKPKAGDLRVWWIPQVPMKAFRIPVGNLEQAALLIETLGRYDAFQYDNHIKPDYCNAGGLEIFSGPEHGWCDWYDDDGFDFDDWMEEHD